MKRVFINCFALFICVLSLCTAYSCIAEEKDLVLPNVLLITLDTTRPDHLGCYGYDRNTSPHLDTFSKEAALFTNAVSSIPLTTPSHATIMTGLNPENHQVYRNSYRVHNNFTMMAEILKKEGYATGGFVSAVLINSQFGFDQGFDNFSDVPQQKQSLVSAKDASAEEKEARQPTIKTEKMLQRRGDKTTDNALEWLQFVAHAPFFAWIHYYDPHLSYTPPDEYGYRFNPEYDRYVENISNPFFQEVAYADQVAWQNMFGDETFSARDGFKLLRDMMVLRQGEYLTPAHMTPQLVEDFISAYDGELSFTDDQVARLFQFLHDAEVYDNTVVIIVGDHGEILYEKENYFGHHRYLYEGSMAVPLLMKIPRVQSRIIENSVTNADILPTLLDVLEIDSSVSMDGRSLWPLISGNGDTMEQDYCFYGTHTGKSKIKTFTTSAKPVKQKLLKVVSIVYRKSIRLFFMKPFRLDRKWKIEKHFDRIAVVKENWKLIRNDVRGENDRARYELYNIDSDPLELQNLVEMEKEVYKELKSALKQHIKTKRLHAAPVPDLQRSDKERQEEIETLRSLGYM
jgi:arylsulfatase